MIQPVRKDRLIFSSVGWGHDPTDPFGYLPGSNRRSSQILPLSLRARKGAAISWYCVRIRTMYQKIATGFALAMTWLTELGDSALAGLLMQWIGGETKGNGTKAVPYDIFRRYSCPQ